MFKFWLVGLIGLTLLIGANYLAIAAYMMWWPWVVPA